MTNLKSEKPLVTAPARRGLLGPYGVDEFPSFKGWSPPAKRTQIDTFTLDQALVLLDGDGTPGGHGGHRFGLGIKPSEFLEGWDVREVSTWLYGVADDPQYGHSTATGFALYGTGTGLEGVVYVRKVHTSRWEIATAHPLPLIEWPL